MKRLLIFALVLFGTCLQLAAQQATLAGTIQLADGTPAVGATIQLVESTHHGVTDVAGFFQIAGIPPGAYLLKVSYLGAADYEAPIELTTQQVLTLDLQLQADQTLLEEVVIRAKSQVREQQEQALQIESVELKAVAGRIKDLTEAIDRLSGVRVRSSGALGDRVNVALNGLDGTAVRTYIDGLPLEFVYPSLHLGNIPLTNIKRVDVYKGILPINIGTDAMGGGINLVTDQKPYNFLRASYGLGAFNTHQFDLNTSRAFNEHLSLSLNASYNYAENNYRMPAFIWEERAVGAIERFHDEYELLFLNVALNIRQQKWADQARLGLGYTDYFKELQNGGLVGRLAFGEAEYEGRTQNLFFDYRKRLGKRWEVENFLAQSAENIVFRDTTRNAYSWSGAVIGRNTPGEFSAPTLADRDQSSWVNRTNWTYTPGSQNQIMLSNLLAYQRVNGRDPFLPEAQDILTRSQTLLKEILGLEYQHTFFQQKLETALAAKLYYYDLRGVDLFAFSPVMENNTTTGWYASAKYKFTDRFFLRASYERAWRIPDYEQFFGNGANIISNVNLRPEASDNFNVGMAFRSSQDKEQFHGSLEFNGFLRGQEDIIYLTPDIISRYINAEEVRTIGLEGELEINFLRAFRFNANLTRLRKTYVAIDSDVVVNQFLVGTAFPNTPSLFGNTALHYQWKGPFLEEDQLRIYVQYKYVAEFNFLNESQIRNDDNFVPVQHRLDAGVSYALPKDRLTLSVNINNVLDRELFDNFRIPRPGIHYHLKLIYQIKHLKSN